MKQDPQASPDRHHDFGGAGSHSRSWRTERRRLSGGRGAPPGLVASRLCLLAQALQIRPAGRLVASRTARVPRAPQARSPRPSPVPKRGTTPPPRTTRPGPGPARAEGLQLARYGPTRPAGVALLEHPEALYFALDFSRSLIVAVRLTGLGGRLPGLGESARLGVWSRTAVSFRLAAGRCVASLEDEQLLKIVIHGPLFLRGWRRGTGRLAGPGRKCSSDLVSGDHGLIRRRSSGSAIARPAEIRPVPELVERRDIGFVKIEPGQPAGPLANRSKTGTSSGARGGGVAGIGPGGSPTAVNTARSRVLDHSG